jgi:hypothetical protein
VATPPLPFPAAQGKPGKFFSRIPYAEKASAIIDLLVPFGNNRRLGREPAGKAKNARIPVWHYSLIAIIQINN